MEGGGLESEGGPPLLQTSRSVRLSSSTSDPFSCLPSPHAAICRERRPNSLAEIYAETHSLNSLTHRNYQCKNSMQKKFKGRNCGQKFSPRNSHTEIHNQKLTPRNLGNRNSGAENLLHRVHQDSAGTPNHCTLEKTWGKCT